MQPEIFDSETILFATGYILWAIMVLIFFIARGGIEWIIGEEKLKISNGTPIEECIDVLSRISSHHSSLSGLKLLFALTWPFSAIPVLRWLAVPIQKFLSEYINPEVWLVCFSAASLCGFIFLLKGTLPELRASLSQIVRGNGK